MIRLLTKNAGEAEIAKLYNSITREQNVFRFDISMNTIVQMAIVDSLQRLPNDAHGGLHWYPVKLIFKMSFSNRFVSPRKNCLILVSTQLSELKPVKCQKILSLNL